MAQGVNLTKSRNRIVKSVKFEAQQDYLRDGPGGQGWAFASFDMIRSCTSRIEYTDGTSRAVHYTSEDDVSELNIPIVGDEDPEVKIVCPFIVIPAGTNIPF